MTVPGLAPVLQLRLFARTFHLIAFRTPAPVPVPLPSQAPSLAQALAPNPSFLFLPRALAGLALALATLCPAPAAAWGAEGHRLIAALALPALQPTARAELGRLLALEPGSSLESIATWADEHRAPQTARWHYLNFPRGDCRYEAARDCPGGACVVAAIERQAALLRSGADAAARLHALKYLVHLVGDVHQPLHAGLAEDRGGNRYQVQGFGRGSNLHALWDSGLLRQRPGGAAALGAELMAEQRAELQSEAKLQAVSARPSARPAALPLPELEAAGDPAQWAMESCRIVAAPDFYPSGHKVDSSYAEAQETRLRSQLRRAARRLARVLNESLPRQTQ